MVTIQFDFSFHPCHVMRRVVVDKVMVAWKKHCIMLLCIVLDINYSPTTVSMDGEYLPLIRIDI